MPTPLWAAATPASARGRHRSSAVLKSLFLYAESASSKGSAMAGATIKAASQIRTATQAIRVFPRISHSRCNFVRIAASRRYLSRRDRNRQRPHRKRNNSIANEKGAPRRREGHEDSEPFAFFVTSW